MSIAELGWPGVNWDSTGTGKRFWCNPARKARKDLVMSKERKTMTG